MLNNNNDGQSCEFFADIVSYLYSETGEGERRKFESHLSSCDICTDEFATISNARFSIFEWQREEFAKLPTPEFHIPYASQEAKSSGGFMSTLRKAFSFGTWQSAAPAFGALLLCVGLAIAAFIYWAPKNEQVAGNKKPNAPESRDDIAIPSRASGNNDVAIVKEPEGRRSDVTGGHEMINPSVRPAKETDRRAETQAARVPRQSFSQSRHEAVNISARTPRPVLSKAPVLSKYDDDDDKTLRLSDLFEDGDS